MNSSESIAMAHKLTPARQNEILGRCNWNADGTVQVQCTLRTEPLLRLAGIDHPRVLETYALAVFRDTSGFLVIDREKAAAAAEEESLYGPGGLFAGMERDPAPEKHPGPPQINPDFFVDWHNAIRSRRFEIRTGDRSKVRIEILSYDDKSLPSPLEREQWESREPTDADVHAAISALARGRDLKHFER